MKTIIYGFCAVMGAIWATQLPGAASASELTRSERDSNAAKIETSISDTTELNTLRSAAIQGDITACKALGACYGDPAEAVVPRNLHAALNWYLKAAAQGDAEAQRLAGQAWLALNDDLEEPRPVETANARYWLTCAASAGDDEARRLLDEQFPEKQTGTAAPQPEAPVPAGHTEAYPAHPEDYVRLLNAFDTAASHGTRLMTPQDPKLGVVINRSRFEELRDRILTEATYNAPTYRAALDSLHAHHVIRTFDDMGLDFMLFKVKSYYDTLPVLWSDFRQTAPGQYEVTDLNTQSVYVIERAKGQTTVRRIPTGANAAPPLH